jgi:hypothetical protein
MAETIVIVCDVCGDVPAETVRIAARGKNYAKDLCSKHLAELVSTARAPQRGRPRKALPAPTPAPARRRGRPPKSASTAAITTPKRRGRPPKFAPAAPGRGSSSPLKGRKITDPAVLQKRRDALAKARAARAAKRTAK